MRVRSVWDGPQLVVKTFADGAAVSFCISETTVAGRYAQQSAGSHCFRFDVRRLDGG